MFCDVSIWMPLVLRGEEIGTVGATLGAKIELRGVLLFLVCCCIDAFAFAVGLHLLIRLLWHFGDDELGSTTTRSPALRSAAAAAAELEVTAEPTGSDGRRSVDCFKAVGFSCSRALLLEFNRP